jgi:hypothetical protein
VTAMAETEQTSQRIHTIDDAQRKRDEEADWP